MKRHDYRKTLEAISGQSVHDHHRVFVAFCRLAACALAAQTREPEYLEEAKRWKPEHLELFSVALGELVVSMEEAPFTDLLGPTHEEWSSSYSKKHGGEFYTPPEVSKLMARMVGVVMPEKGPSEIQEPAVGAGSMILAYIEYAVQEGYSPLNFRVQAWDVSAVACDMAFINFSLWSIPAEIVWGDTLRMKVHRVWRNLWHPLAHGLPKAEPARAEQKLEVIDSLRKLVASPRPVVQRDLWAGIELEVQSAD